MKIIIDSWNEGFQKVSLTHLQIELLRLSLKTAKSNVDKLLNGEKITIEIDDEQLVLTFIQEAKKIEANCRIKY